MALTATASQGFEDLHKASGDEVFLLPGDPGVTFVKGDKVVITNGVLALADGDSNSFLKVLKTVACPAATQAFPHPFNAIDDNDEDKTLVPVRVTTLNEGTQIEKVTFSGHYDDTVVSYTAGTRAIACTTGMGADDRPNGGILYVYEGAGAGEVNVVEDYDHTGGAAELLLICHRPFKATLDTTSKFIVLGGEAAASAGIAFMGLVDPGDEDSIHVNDGYDDGTYRLCFDFVRAAALLKNLMVAAVPANRLL